MVAGHSATFIAAASRWSVARLPGTALKIAGINAQRVAEPFAVDSRLRRCVRSQRRPRVKPLVEARVGIVAARVAGVGLLGVVRRRSLAQDGETGGAVAMVLQQFLEQPLPLLRIGRQAKADDEQPIQTRGRQVRGQIDAEAHADVDGAIEVDQPAEIVADDQLAVLLTDLLVLGRVRIRTGVQRPRNLAADLLDHRRAVGGPDQHESIRQHARPAPAGSRTAAGRPDRRCSET